MSEAVAPSAERPRVAPAVATAALVLGILAALVQVPHDWSKATPIARAHAERLALPLRSIDIDPRLYAAAEQIIPPDASYTIVTGPGVQVSTPLTLDGVEAQAGFWLLPRRHTPFASKAQWVISYGGDLGDRAQYRRIVPVAPGMAVAELKPR